MRIDYSTPKQSYVSNQSKPKPRKESNGFLTSIIAATALTCFIAGYGAGWFFSQRSAKKSFQAATEQKSLESTPKPVVNPQTPSTQQPANPTQQPENSSAQPGQATPNGVQPTLSFYKTLPSDQKNSALGSGINTADNKTKPQPSPNSLVSPAAKASPATKAAPAEKTAAKVQESNTFAVQVASYSLKSEAEGAKVKLANKGYNVSLVESNLGDKGIWYRVRVGKKLDHDAAKELAGKLGKGAMIIPD